MINIPVSHFIILFCVEYIVVAVLFFFLGRDITEHRISKKK